MSEAKYAAIRKGFKEDVKIMLLFARVLKKINGYHSYMQGF